MEHCPQAPALLPGLACRTIALVFALAASEAAAQEGGGLTETYGDWTVQCRPAGQGSAQSAPPDCQVSQELRRPETGERVVLAAVTPAADGPGEVITLILPFGLLLSEGAGLSLDDTQFVTMPFRTCLSSVGCVAEKRLTADQVAQLASAAKMGVHMVALSGQPVLAELSLTGFGPARDRLRALSP